MTPWWNATKTGQSLKQFELLIHVGRGGVNVEELVIQTIQRIPPLVVASPDVSGSQQTLEFAKVDRTKVEVLLKGGTLSLEFLWFVALKMTFARMDGKTLKQAIP